MLLNVLDQSVMSLSEVRGGSNLMAGSLSPDGTRWLAVGDGGNFGLVDTRDMRRRMGTIEGLGVFPWACAFSPDGTRAFVAGDGVLAELPGGVAVDGAAQPEDSVRFLARGGWIQPRGMHISGGSAPWASLFSQGVGYAWAPLDGSPSQMVDVGRTGRLVASAVWIDDSHGYFASGNGRVQRFELDASGRTPRIDPSFVAPDEAVQSMAATRDGARLALGLVSGGLAIVDARSGAVLGRSECQHAIWSVGFVPEGDRVFAGDRSGRLHVVELSPEGAILRSRVLTAGSGSVIWALGVLDRDEVIANVGGAIVRLDSSPRWSVEAARFGGEPLGITDFDGRRMRAVAADGAVRELDMAEGAWRGLPHGAPRAGVHHAISRDGRGLASVVDGMVRVVDLETGAVAESEPFAVGHRAIVAWSDDGGMVAAVSTAEALLLDRDGRTLAREPVDGVTDISALVWHARDQFVAIEPFDTPRRLAFRYRKGALKHELEPVASALGAIRSQGRWIVPMLNGEVLISWPGGADLLEGDVEHYQLRLRGHDDYAIAGDISPDRKWIATGGADGRVRLWSAEDGEPVFSLPLHESRIRWIRWSNDGKSLLSMGLRGDVRVLDSVSRAERVRSAPRGSGGEMLGKPVEADAAAAK
jgi:WD40 repeat protein